MSSITHKLAASVSSTTASTSLSGSDQESGNSEIVIDESFAAATSNGALTLALTQANIQSIFLVSPQGCTLTTNGTGTADVQTVSITGTPTGGTFPLVFGGAVTTALSYAATAAQVQTALQALATIGSGNITCTGGPLPGTAIVCTFAGTKNKGLQALITTESGDLTGGSSPTVSVAHTTTGLPQDTIVLVAGIPLVWGKSAGYSSNPFAGNVTSAFVTCTPAARIQGKILTS